MVKTSVCILQAHDADRRLIDRLKASLERLQRLTQGYTDAMLEVFPSRAAALGKGLGLPEEPVQVCVPPPLY